MTRESTTKSHCDICSKKTSFFNANFLPYLPLSYRGDKEVICRKCVQQIDLFCKECGEKFPLRVPVTGPPNEPPALCDKCLKLHLPEQEGRCDICGTRVGFWNPNSIEYLPKSFRGDYGVLCASCVHEIPLSCEVCGNKFSLRAPFKGPPPEEPPALCDACLAEHEEEVKSLKEADASQQLATLGQHVLCFENRVIEMDELVGSVATNFNPLPGNPIEDTEDFLRKNPWFKGRQYQGFHDFVWLANEIHGYFCTKGRENCMKWLQRPNLVIFDNLGMMVILQKSGAGVNVRIGPDHLPGGLVTGAALVVMTGGLGLAAGAALKAKFGSEVKKLLDFVDQRVQEQMRQSFSSGSTLSEQVSEIPSQIQALAKLKEDGILTEEEFISKKKELLDKM